MEIPLNKLRIASILVSLAILVGMVGNSGLEQSNVVAFRSEISVGSYANWSVFESMTGNVLVIAISAYSMNLTVTSVNSTACRIESVQDFNGLITVSNFTTNYTLGYLSFPYLNESLAEMSMQNPILPGFKSTSSIST